MHFQEALTVLDLLNISLPHISTLGIILAEPSTPGLAEAIKKITDGLTPVFLPLAGLSLTIFFLLMIGAPILPEAAQSNKGFFMKACLALVVVGMIPTIVSWLYGLGGGASPNALGPLLPLLA
jgi:hypothetical protein